MVVRQLETVQAAENRGGCPDAERLLGDNLHRSNHDELSVRD